MASKVHAQRLAEIGERAERALRIWQDELCSKVASLGSRVRDIDSRRADQLVLVSIRSDFARTGWSFVRGSRMTAVEVPPSVEIGQYLLEDEDETTVQRHLLDIARSASDAQRFWLTTVLQPLQLLIVESVEARVEPDMLSDNWGGMLEESLDHATKVWTHLRHLTHDLRLIAYGLELD